QACNPSVVLLGEVNVDYVRARSTERTDKRHDAERVGNRLPQRRGPPSEPGAGSEAIGRHYELYHTFDLGTMRRGREQEDSMPSVREPLGAGRHMRALADPDGKNRQRPSVRASRPAWSHELVRAPSNPTASFSARRSTSIPAASRRSTITS